METQNQIISTKRYDDIQNTYQSFSIKPEPLGFCKVPDEPIDLTVSPTDLTYNNRKKDMNFSTFIHKDIQNCDYQIVNKKFDTRLRDDEFQIVNCPEELFLDQTTLASCGSKRKIRRKFMYTNEGNVVLISEENTQPPPAITQAKQLEILKAAKSLFSKRTRTLYHWMYPTASKQQVKSTVMTSWDSLAESEKAFYISQVLGRFGLTQSNLMVNPQLGTIKEPPPLVGRVGTAVTHTKARELQSAISSISPGTSSSSIDNGSMSFEEFEALNERTRKRRGRPKGNHGCKKVKNGVNGDFQDDPELSQELEKFAIKFNLNRLY